MQQDSIDESAEPDAEQNAWRDQRAVVRLVAHVFVPFCAADARADRGNPTRYASAASAPRIRRGNNTSTSCDQNR
jgi:hypothetical protein